MTDGRNRGHEICGIWIVSEGKFCEEFVFSLRRCKRHYYALKKDDLWRLLQLMTKEQREIALNVLDEMQRHRPHWQYEGNEAGLIAEQERKRCIKVASQSR